MPYKQDDRVKRGYYNGYSYTPVDESKRNDNILVASNRIELYLSIDERLKNLILANGHSYNINDKSYLVDEVENGYFFLLKCYKFDLLIKNQPYKDLFNAIYDQCLANFKNLNSLINPLDELEKKLNLKLQDFRQKKPGSEMSLSLIGQQQEPVNTLAIKYGDYDYEISDSGQLLFLDQCISDLETSPTKENLQVLDRFINKLEKRLRSKFSIFSNKESKNKFLEILRKLRAIYGKEEELDQKLDQGSKRLILNHKAFINKYYNLEIKQDTSLLNLHFTHERELLHILHRIKTVRIRLQEIKKLMIENPIEIPLKNMDETILDYLTLEKNNIDLFAVVEFEKIIYNRNNNIIVDLNKKLTSYFNKTNSSFSSCSPEILVYIILRYILPNLDIDKILNNGNDTKALEIVFRNLSNIFDFAQDFLQNKNSSSNTNISYAFTIKLNELALSLSSTSQCMKSSTRIPAGILLTKEVEKNNLESHAATSAEKLRYHNDHLKVEGLGTIKCLPITTHLGIEGTNTEFNINTEEAKGEQSESALTIISNADSQQIQIYKENDSLIFFVMCSYDIHTFKVEYHHYTVDPSSSTLCPDNIETTHTKYQRFMGNIYNYYLTGNIKVLNHQEWKYILTCIEDARIECLNQHKMALKYNLLNENYKNYPLLEYYFHILTRLNKDIRTIRDILSFEPEATQPQIKFNDIKQNIEKTKIDEYFRLLEISDTERNREDIKNIIKKQYRKLALKVHPDKVELLQIPREQKNELINRFNLLTEAKAYLENYVDNSINNNQENTESSNTNNNSNTEEYAKDNNEKHNLLFLEGTKNTGQDTSTNIEGTTNTYDKPPETDSPRTDLQTTSILLQTLENSEKLQPPIPTTNPISLPNTNITNSNLEVTAETNKNGEQKLSNITGLLGDRGGLTEELLETYFPKTDSEEELKQQLNNLELAFEEIKDNKGDKYTKNNKWYYIFNNRKLTYTQKQDEHIQILKKWYVEILKRDTNALREIATDKNGKLIDHQRYKIETVETTTRKAINKIYGIESPRSSIAYFGTSTE